MQIEFEGKVHEFPDDFSEEDISYALASLNKEKPKRKTGFFEDVGIGVTNAGHNVADAAQMVAGGLSGIVGAEDTRDSIFDSMVARQKTHDAELAQLDRGIGGQITSTVSQAVPMLLGGAVVAGAKGAALVPSIINAISQSGKNIQQGASTKQAMLQAPVEGIIDYVSNMLPVGKGILRGAGWGAGGNVAGQAGTDVAGQVIMGDTEAAQNYQFERDKYLVTAGTGVVVGGGVGGVTKSGPKSADAQAADAQRSGDKTKLDKDGRPVPEYDQVNQEVIDRNNAAIVRNETFQKKTQEQIDAETALLEKLEKIRHETPEEAEKAASTIEDLKKRIEERSLKLEESLAEVDGYHQDNARRGQPSQKEAPESPRTPEDVVPLDDAPFIRELDQPVPEDSAKVQGLQENIAALERFLGTKQGSKEARADVEAELAQTRAELEAELSKTTETTPLPNEIKTIQAEIDARSTAVLKAKNSIDSPSDMGFDPKVEQVQRDAISRGVSPLEATLRHAADNVDDSLPKAVANLAKTLLDNPLTRPIFVKISSELADYDAQSRAMYLPSKHITLFGRAGINAFTTIHEVLHSATSAVLNMVRLNHTKNLTPTQIAAAKKIQKLYDLAKERGLIKDPRIVDIDEFMAYGLIDRNFTEALGQSKYLGDNLRDSILRSMYSIVGIKSTLHSELLKQTKAIIKEDKGQSYEKWDPDFHKAILDEAHGVVREIEKDVQAKPNYALVSQTHTGKGTPQEAHQAKLEAIIEATLQGEDTPRNLFSRNWFGWQQYREQLANHPLLAHTVTTIESALNTKNQLLRNWVGGTPQNAVRPPNAGHAVTTLQHAQSGDAPLLLLKHSTDADVNVVRKAIIYNFNNGIDHLSNIPQGLTKTQENLYRALAGMFQKMREDTNNDRKIRGMPLVPQRDGWVSAIRSGDFFVYVKDKWNATVHMERFRSKYEVDLFTKKLSRDFKVEVLDSKSGKLDAEQIERIQRDTAEMMGEMQKYEDARMAQTLYANKTHHDMFRQGVSGYLGNRWGRSDAQNVRDFREAMNKSVDEYANAHKNAILNHETNNIMERLGKEAEDSRKAQDFQNALDDAKTLLDSARGKHGDAIAGYERFVRSVIDDNIARAANSLGKNKDWYPKIPILDRTHGIAAQLFYLAALTTRPGFWAAQLLSTPQAFRHLFKETNSVTATANIGKGLFTAMSGGDKDFQNAVYWVANNRDTFHPQFINEINELPGVSRAFSGKAKTLMEWGTGQRMASGADSLSRYITFAVMYENYKAQGLRGEALINKSAEATERTMVMYNAPYKAPIIQKAGLVGQAVAPLTTFAMAQQGLLMADLKSVRKDIRNVAPLIATTLTTAMMGGVIGLPMLVEYELLSDWLGEDDEGKRKLPSVRQFLLEADNKGVKIAGLDAQTVLLGGATAAADSAAKGMGMEEGFDIGSGLRWNQVLSKTLTGEAGLIDAVPAIKYATDIAAAIKVITTDLGGGLVSENDLLKAKRTITVLVGQKALVELVEGYNERTMNAAGNTGKASKAATDADVLSTLVGSQSISARKEGIKQALVLEQRKDAKEVEKEYGVIAIESFMRGDKERGMRALNKILKENPTANINSIFKKIIMDKNVPQYVRDYMAKNPDVILQRMSVGQ